MHELGPVLADRVGALPVERAVLLAHMAIPDQIPAGRWLGAASTGTSLRFQGCTAYTMPSPPENAVSNLAHLVPTVLGPAT